MSNDQIQVQAEATALPRLPNESRSSLKQVVEEENAQDATNPSTTLMQKIR